MRTGFAIAAGGLVAAAAVAWLTAHVLRQDGPAATPEPEERAVVADGAPAVALEGRRTAVALAPDPASLVEVVGRVVDGAGEAVAHADVVLDVDGAETCRASGDDGRFLLVAAFPGGTARVVAEVRATDGERAVARGVVLRVEGEAFAEDDTARRDVGDLVLVASAEVRFQVIGAAPAVVHLTAFEDGLVRTRRIETDARGAAGLRGVAPALYRIVAVTEVEGFGRAVTVRRLPPEERGPIVLTLPPERSVRVTARSGGGPPLPGATVHVTESLGGRPPTPMAVSRMDATTDESGEAWVRGLAPDDVFTVVVGAPGHRRGTADVRATDDEVVVSLASHFTARWKIVPGTAPVPPGGTLVAIRSHGVATLPSTGRVEGAELFVHGWPPGGGAADAVAPDGSIASLGGREPISFRWPVEAEVVLRAEDGAPLAGWLVFAPASGAPFGEAVTDANGRAGFTGLPDGGAVSFGTVVPGDGRRMTLGGLRLDRGERRLTVTVPDVREVEVLVRLDGRIGLPPAGEPPTLMLDGQRAARVERDEGRNVLRTRWRAGPSTSALGVHVHAPGRMPGFDHRRFVPGRPPAVLRFDVNLTRTAALEVQVRLPADGVHAVALEQSPDGRTWSPTASHGEPPVPLQADAGVVRFPRVGAGILHRAVDVLSGAVSEPVVGDDGAVAVLDLSRAVWVEGRVHGPGGAPVGDREAVVVASTVDPTKARGRPPTAAVRADGTFRLRLSWDAPMRLAVRHPRLPSAEALVLTDPPKEPVRLTVGGR
jgi:hypothetical protein